MIRKIWGWATSHHKNNNLFLLIVYFSFILLIFFILLFFHNLINIYNKKVTLNNLWIITYYWDKNLSKFILTLDNLLNPNIKFDKKKENILFILNYIKTHNLPNLNQFKNYQNFYNFTKKFITTYGVNQTYKLIKPTKTYLIILENIWEVRPNWWFFGSFWVLNITNSWFDIKILDSYYPVYVNRINLPISWNYIKTLLWKNYINFISPNIFWFTNTDWKNIAKLYEKTFNKKVNGVIFVKSSLFEKYFPKLKNKIYEWQFINASIDLIRWKKEPFKKEIYLKQINNFLKENRKEIISDILKNRNQLIKNWYIQIWIPTLEKNYKIKNLLEKNNLILEKKDNCFYFFDYNFWYNKIDRFLQKEIYISKNWKILFEVHNNNKLCLSKKEIDKIKWGNIKINYFLNIPQSYINFIKKLEKKYKIKLTPREKHILWLTPKVKNKWIIWLPKSLWWNFIIYNYKIKKNRSGTNLSIPLTKQEYKTK